MDNIWIALIMFVAGVILVVKGGDWFVDAASWIARAANIPTFVIGATIVSLATTMPEMIVSVMAALEGKNDMAVGNAVGSVTANTGLIMALAFVFMTVIAPRKDYIKQCLILIVTAAILWLGSLGGQMQPWAVVVLFAVFVGFMALNVADAKRKPAKSEPMDKSGKIVAKNVVMFIVGAGCIVLGSNLLIDGGSAIAVAVGVPERVIAVTMVAIGTSLPELVTTITAIRKKQSSLSVGNIVGANIIDLALILPICTVVSGSSFAVSAQCLRIDFPACMLVILIAMVPLLIRQKASRLQGILMMAAYIGYLVITL